MFYIIISIVSLVCVILAAVCGYMFATLKALRSSGTPKPVSVPDVPHVAIQTPEPIETPAPARVIIEPVKVAEPVSVPESPKPVKTPSPKSAPKAAEPKPATKKANEGKKETLPLPEGAPAKPVRSDYPNTDEGLASYKYDVHQYWNKVTALRRKMAKSGTSANVVKAEPKAAPVPETKPEPKKAPKAPKAEPVKNEPKAEPKPEPKPEPVKAAEPVTEHTKAELLESIKAFNGITIYDARINVKFGKDEVTIREINSTTALLANGKEVKLSAVPFSRAILENIIVACTKASKTPKDVQPVSDEVRYSQNTAEGIVRTLNNKSIQSVTFTDSIKTIFTEPKTKKTKDVEITGLRRTDKGEVYVTFAMANNKVGRFELIKGASVFNYETLRTIQKQVNAGIAKTKNANARIEYMKSVAA